MITVSKLVAETRNFVVDYSAELSASEQLISFSGLVISPADVALTVTPSIVNAGKAINFAVSGGTANKSHTISLTVTSSLAQVIIRDIGLSILAGQNVIPTDSEDSIPRLAGSLSAGDSVLGQVLLNFAAAEDLSAGTLLWELLDNQGILHASGFGEYTVQTSVTGSKLLSGKAIISTPSDLAPTSGSQSYQLRWTLSRPGLPSTSSYETLTVTSHYEVSHGVEDVVELQGAVARMNCILERSYDNVDMEVYDRFDNVVLTAPVKSSEIPVDGGVAYFGTVDTANFLVDLVPRTVCFKYRDGQPNSPVYRSFGRLYVVTPTTQAACEDLRTFINRTNTTVAGRPDMVFTVPHLLTFLRMGRDHFNMIFQITNFTMARASGGIRDGWLKCSSIQALRSQFIAEGEQAFDYQGQAISLTVDRTQYYETLASNIEGQLEMYNKFKTQLTKRGITDGDGDLDNTRGKFGNIAAVGLNLSPVSGFGLSGYRRRMPLW